MPSQHPDKFRRLQGLRATAESRPEALSGFTAWPFLKVQQRFCLSRAKNPTRAKALV